MDGFSPVIIAFIILVLIPVMGFFIFLPMIRQNKVLNGIENYDVLMRKFIFRVEMTKDEFFKILRKNDSSDVLSFTLKDESTIVFEQNCVRVPYLFSVEELDGFIVLRVQQAHCLHNKTNIPYYVNEFWIRKVGAKPLPFSSYPF